MIINLVTNVGGFPHGMAPVHRQKMIAKALICSGYIIKIYTNTLVNNDYNTLPYGSHEGIDFYYLHGMTKLNVSKLYKWYLYIKGIVVLFGIIKKFDPKNDLVYLYSQGSPFNIFVIIYCKIFKIKIIQEINEWYHRQLKRHIETLISEGPMIKWSDGAIVISRNINKKVIKINPEIKTIIIPVLEDACQYQYLKPIENNSVRYCFWMGEVDTYLLDIESIVKALAKVFQRGHTLDFFISGPYNVVSAIRIFEVAAIVGFPSNHIYLLGYLSEDRLLELCRNSYLYILPLLNDERSSSRFPTKVATFMFCGRPLIICPIGDLDEMLRDGENVLFFIPGDVDSLTEKIILLINDELLYNRICENTYKFANTFFNYKEYSNRLNDFVLKVMDK